MKKANLTIIRTIIALVFLLPFVSCEKDDDSKNDDASLKGIYIESELIENFTPENLSYELSLEYGTTNIPQITVEANDANASVNIIQATGIPGIYIITVVAENNFTTNVYTLNLIEDAPSTDATLKTITIHGVDLEEFNAETTEYQIELAEGTTEAPIVDAIVNDENSTIEITQASAIPGTATIVVTAQNSSYTKEYKINFTVPVSFGNIAEILTSYQVWLCTAYEELNSGQSDVAPDGSMFFTISYDASGSCFFSYGPDPEDQFEGTWEVTADNKHITYFKGTEDEYTTTVLELTQSIFKYNDAWTTQDGTNVNYNFTLEPFTGKSSVLFETLAPFHRK